MKHVGDRTFTEVYVCQKLSDQNTTKSDKEIANINGAVFWLTWCRFCSTNHEERYLVLEEYRNVVDQRRNDNDDDCTLDTSKCPRPGSN